MILQFPSRSAVMQNPLCAALLAIVCAWGATAQTGPDITLNPDDIVPIGQGVYRANILDPPDMTGNPVVDRNNSDPVFGMLRRRFEAGEAQGFAGVVYENRDRGHSRLRRKEFPALTLLGYNEELRQRGLDYGLAGVIRTNLVTIGNSSTAVTRGPYKRSQSRKAMTDSGGPDRMFGTYENNQIYVYPEHRDYDDVDRFPANWPYTVTSQGSSGSDREFLRAIALTLASFRPVTFERLRAEGLLAPTIQMIMRQELATVTDPAHYFTGRAHPVVFQGRDLRPGRMAARAAALAPDAIPPMMRLRVETEDFLDQAGLAGLSERFFDTPSAIARIWRDTSGRKSMTVTAAGTRDPNGRDLSFSWHVLSGDAGKVRIEPLDSQGRRAKLEFDWQDPKVLRGRGNEGKGQLVSRVDIGVFADNGVELSAPALISVDIPEHQTRVYYDGQNEAPQLISVDYDAVGRKVYYDPLLYWSAPWADRASGDGLERRRSVGAWTAVGNKTYEIDRSRPSYPILVPRD